MTAFVYNMHNSQRRVPVGQAIPSGETGEGADSAGGRPERTPAAGELQGLAQAERETAPALCGPVFRTGHFFLFDRGKPKKKRMQLQSHGSGAFGAL